MGIPSLEAPVRRLPRLVSVIVAALAAAAAAVVLWRRRSGAGREGRLEWEGPAGGDAAVMDVAGSGDDARLLARVESELFRDPELPKGDIVLDVVDGVVTIRGQVAAGLVEDIGVRVGAVEGVVRVENLLHAPPEG